MYMSISSSTQPHWSSVYIYTHKYIQTYIHTYKYVAQSACFGEAVLFFRVPTLSNIAQKAPLAWRTCLASESLWTHPAHPRMRGTRAKDQNSSLGCASKTSHCRFRTVEDNTRAKMPSLGSNPRGTASKHGCPLSSHSLVH